MTEEEIELLILEKAKYLKNRLLEHYLYYKEYFPTQPVKIYGRFFFDIIDEIGKTIIYKSVGFEEEKEWRLYINEWLSKSFVGVTPGGSLGKVVKYLEGKISYHITEDDIIPFILFEFGDKPSKYIDRIILGPANKISDKDIKLFLEQKNYINTETMMSRITYR